MIRGVGELLSVAAAWIWAGPIKPILLGHQFDVSEMKTSMPIALLEPFGRLRQMVSEMCDVEDIRKTLLESIAVLEEIYAEVLCSHRAGHDVSKNPGLGWKWPQKVSQHFISLLRESHGGTLIIFSHFAVLSEAWGERWYLKGWPSRVVEACSNNVSVAWKPWMAWPEKQVKEKFPIFEIREPKLGETLESPA